MIIHVWYYKNSGMSYKSQVIRQQSGMAAILTVVIVGAAVLIMAKSASLSAVDDVMVSAEMNKGQEAMSIAGGCAEETLRRIQLDPGYTANDYVLTLGNEECTISASINSGQHIIDVLGRVDDYYQRLRVRATIDGAEVVIGDWEETD